MVSLPHVPAAILHPGEKLPAKGDLIIAPQFQLHHCRLDFLIIGRDDYGNQKWVNVECDGAEWHNANMAQYQADRERDKFVRWCGIEVIRFPGSNIWKDAIGCADEVSILLKRWRWLNWAKMPAALTA